ncbi:hypothetical protein CC80DRAFT_493155 [Byssothecium circinans]|uniref:Uncharacterized protein n=1 Tax=Byssothecium circinans TaxID=147558 RepID=A0A6A5TSG0_9PLEO|nr:hypothetical protein CC80DRAFT_493155 [Byssothecium circinans]
MATPGATSNLSLTKISPLQVEVVPSPSYAPSEYASVHRQSRRLSNLSMLESMPPPPPPPKDESKLVNKPKDTLPQLPPVHDQPRPMSFLSFIAQAPGRSPVQAQQPQRQQQQQQQRSQIPIPPTPTTTPISPDAPSTTKSRRSRRTSLKSYIGRNGLGDEGIFVATSDDPDIPFTLFRWPNERGSHGTPRSSQFWPT